MAQGPIVAKKYKMQDVVSHKTRSGHGGGALPKQLENQVSLCGCTRGNFNAKRMYCIYYLHTCIFSIKFCITWISLQPQALNILCALDKSLTPPPPQGTFSTIKANLWGRKLLNKQKGVCYTQMALLCKNVCTHTHWGKNRTLIKESSFKC